MKKTLLLFTVAILFSAGTFAQEWKLGNDATNFPVSSGILRNTSTTINGLTITSGTLLTSDNTGQVEANAKSFGTFTFINRFKFNGSGYTGAAITQVTPTVFMPTQRYLSFPVTGNTTITAYGITGSSAEARRLFVTDGTTLIGTMLFPASSGAVSEGIVDYKGGATTLYLYCNAAINLYYLKAAAYQSPSITTFTLPVSNVTTINTGALTIGVKVPFGTNVTALAPTIELTTGATNTVSPASTVATDFTSPVNYTVSDGTNSKVYAVTVNVGPSLNITSFTVSGVTATIDQSALTINAVVPIGTGLTALIPTIVLTGTGTTVSPLTGIAANFSASGTTPVNYTVSDGTFTKLYKVTVVEGATGFTQPTISGVTFDGVTIHNASNVSLQVFDTTGRLVASSTKNITMSSFSKGVYVVKSNSGTLKIAL